jgi:hypothetical protein
MQVNTRDTRFYPEIWIHKESYILVDGFTKNRVSQPFFFSRSHQDTLELLTITKMGNTNFPRLTTPSGGLKATSNRLGAKLKK